MYKEVKCSYENNFIYASRFTEPITYTELKERIEKFIKDDSDLDIVDLDKEFDDVEDTEDSNECDTPVNSTESTGGIEYLDENDVKSTEEPTNE
jgi:hypothetical protein